MRASQSTGKLEVSRHGVGDGEDADRNPEASRSPRSHVTGYTSMATTQYDVDEDLRHAFVLCALN